MNNNPENQSQQFDYLAEKFDILEPDQATNINGVEKDLEGEPLYLNRKIDFIFATKTSLLSRIWKAVISFFVSQVSLTYSSARILEDFDFTVKGNCSDHKPVIVKLTLQHKSNIFRIYHYILSYFQ